ncbi:MAG: TIGR02172 family protein [Bacteroidales bacterium]|nr:TIGR02172 family protein [Bacteroidales bacterium]
MANNPLDTTLVDKALHFAINAHGGTERRSKGYPYVIHVMEAASIVASITNDPELIAAAALHDVVEDTPCTVEEIRNEFGIRIAKIIEYESDNTLSTFDRKAPWRERKQAALERLAHAPYDVKIVAMGDKLSNMRGIAADYEQIGDKLWLRFHAPNGKADHSWRYHELAWALFDLAATRAYREFNYLVNMVFGEEKYDTPHRINLADYEQSGDGYTAVSYNHKDGHTMIKLYNDFMPVEAAVNELTFARNVVSLGITTPMAGRLITDGKRFGAEFERITPKQSFARAISNAPDMLEEYALRFAQRCRQLHSIECNTALFPPASKAAHQTIVDCPYFADDEKQRMHAIVDSTPEATTCLHGDMHIGNIITNGERDYWIDLGDFGWGNPLYDLGMFYLTSHFNDEQLTQHLYHISSSQIKRVWDIFIREYLQTTDESKIKEVEEQCRPFAALRLMYYGTRGKMDDNMLAIIRSSML